MRQGMEENPQTNLQHGKDRENVELLDDAVKGPTEEHFCFPKNKKKVAVSAAS